MNVSPAFKGGERRQKQRLSSSRVSASRKRGSRQLRRPMLQMEKLRLGGETKSQHVHYVTPSFMLLTVAPCGSAYHYPELGVSFLIYTCLDR